MDEKTLHEAVENISVIKGVMERTSKSFTAFSKTFIYWGLLFIVNSIITLVMASNKEKMLDITSSFPLFSYIFPVGIIAIIAALIYWQISKKISFVGLEKHLMKVWILTLLMNVIPPKITVNSASTSVDLTNIVIQTDNLSVILFSLAIALITTALFAGYKNLMNLGIIYIAISVIHAYFRIPMFAGSTLLHFLYSVSLPFTFLYVGFFLKTQQARGN